MEYIYILMLLIPVFSALLLLIRPELWKSVSCISGSAVFLLCLAAAVFPPERLELFRIMELEFYLRPDGLSMFFACLFSFLFLASLVFNLEYSREDPGAHLLCCWLMLTLSSLIALCMSPNLPTFYMFFECVSLCSFPLVLHNRESRSRYAAMKYLGYSSSVQPLYCLVCSLALTALAALSFLPKTASWGRPRAGTCWLFSALFLASAAKPDLYRSTPGCLSPIRRPRQLPPQCFQESSPRPGYLE